MAKTSDLLKRLAEDLLCAACRTRPRVANRQVCRECLRLAEERERHARSRLIPNSGRSNHQQAGASISAVRNFKERSQLSRTDRAVIAEDVRSRTNDPTVLRSRQTDMRCRTWPKTPKQNPSPAAPRRWRRYARLAWSAATAATPRSEPARRRPVRFGCSGSAATRLL